jgi:hypothetical protein
MEWKLVVSKVVIHWSVLSLIPPDYYKLVVKGRPLANAGIVMIGEVTKEYCLLKFCTTLVRIRHSA